MILKSQILQNNRVEFFVYRRDLTESTDPPVLYVITLTTHSHLLSLDLGGLKN